MTPYYHGTRTPLTPGTELDALFSPDLDAAIWDAELASGDEPPRVYVVETRGDVEDTAPRSEAKPPRPWMSWRSREALRVVSEVTAWPHYHGTKADFRVGDLIAPGWKSNFTADERALRHVYFARTLEAAKWGAELALGDGAPRIYLVEPTGPIEDDPNVTNKRFRGNPTKSFRSLAPLRVTGEVTGWQGHSPEAIKAMKDGLARLQREGRAVIEE